jgi:hypothetical protein
MRAVVVAMVLVSTRAAAEPTANVPPVASQPTPRVAAPASGAATWKEGFMVVPMIGVNSFQGDGAHGTGPGLRLGLLMGSRLNEHVSLNVGFAFDIANLDTPPGVDASRYVLDIGFNPLFHFPLQRLDIVAGPLAGAFVDHGSLGGLAPSVDTWAYGWTIGANAGVLFPVGATARLGGLANFYLRNPLNVCAMTTAGDSCSSTGVDAVKTLALSFAALL